MRHASPFRRKFDLEPRLTPALSLIGPWSPGDRATAEAFAANLWAAPTGVSIASDQPGQPAQAVSVRLDTLAVEARFAASPAETRLALPRADGSLERFRVWPVEIMAPDLAAAFPDIRAYRGQSLDEPSTHLALELTPTGFRAKANGPKAMWYVEPTDAPAGEYQAFVPGRPGGHHTGCGCADCAAVAGFGGSASGGRDGPFGPQSVSGASLRTLRLAVAATGEYTAFAGGTVNAAQAAIVTVINRINLTFERDFATRMVLVANNQNVIYTNAATDPYTGDSPFPMIDENQANLDSVIGSANYDIGHVFSSHNSGGVASLGSIGNPTQKGRASTGAPPWDTATGFFLESTASHEFGHSFGANHSFNSIVQNDNRWGPTAYEPGSGSTIMSYAGISGTDNLQDVADLFFHSISHQEVTNFLATIPDVGTFTATNNAIPAVNAGADAVIPARTPFSLTAAATDADGPNLTYSWEQFDLGPAQALDSGDNGSSPLFRAFAPSTNPTRTFPNMTNLLAGTPSKGELLPTTNRELNFRVLVRDNRANGGAAQTDDVKLTVIDTGSPFRVTSPNTAVSIPADSWPTVTWDVAGTSGGAVNAKSVNILRSTDGGKSWVTALANTPNDGSEPAPVGTTQSTAARFKVEAAGNYFFDVSDVNFKITAPAAMRVTNFSPAPGLLTLPFPQIDVTFSQPVDAATVGTDDITLTQGNVTAASVQSANVVRYTLSGVTAEGLLTLGFADGAVLSTTANPVAPFYGLYTLDYSTTPIPTPLTAVEPLGSLAYTGSTTGTVNTGTDVDAFTLNLDAGQVISIAATPAAGLRPSITITAPGGANGSADAAAAGKPAVVNTFAASDSGVYTISVKSLDSTTGTYNLRIDLNTSPEVEPNDTTATASKLTGGVSIGGGATRFHIDGRTDPLFGLLPAEVEPNNSSAAANDASKNFNAVTSDLYQLTVSGTHDPASFDWYNLGAMQAGDVITVVSSGTASDRGTAADPEIILVDSSSIGIAFDNDSGPGGDDIIHRFKFTSNDNYFLFIPSLTGTNQISVLLENTSTAPTTGGTQFTEVEPNGGPGNATDISKSWRQVQYQSTTTGTITAGDSDFVKVSLPLNAFLTVQVDASAGLDARVNLRNAAGTVVYSEDGTTIPLAEDSALYSFRAATAGDYFVEVLGAGGTTGTYSLQLSLNSPTPPAGPVVPPDYFALPLIAGQVVSLAIESVAGSNVDLALVDAADAVLASGTVAGNTDEALMFTATKTATVFARVTGVNDTDYRLIAVASAAFDREANDTLATAQPLGNGRALGAIAPTSDEDWYSFAVTAGQFVTLKTSTPGGGPGEFANALDPQIELFDAAGNLVAGDDNSAGDGRNASLGHAATTTGTYRARVRAAAGTAGEYVLEQAVGTDPLPSVNAVTVNAGAAQRSRVTEIAVTFSEAVTLPTNPAEAFKLARTGPGSPGDVTLSAKVNATSVTLTFSGPLTEAASLADGNYTLTVLAAKVTDAGGQPLDGGDKSFNLFRLFGDDDGNRSVNFTDFLAFRSTFGGSSNLAFDSDGSGGVDFIDFLAFRTRFGVALAP